jgi:hypothetical protein
MRESSINWEWRRLLPIPHRAAFLLLVCLSFECQQPSAVECQWKQISAGGLGAFPDSTYCNTIALRPTQDCDSLACIFCYSTSFSSSRFYHFSGEIFTNKDIETFWGPLYLPDTLWSFTFKDNLTGWAAGDHITAGGVYKTTDGGLTWSLPLTTMDRFRSVHYVAITHRLLACGVRATYFSDDLGVTWSVLRPEIHTNFAFSDGLHGVASSPLGQTMIYTSDGGLTWSNSGLLGAEFQPLGIAESKTFFALSEAGPLKNALLRSDDGGATWKTIHQFPAVDSLTGCITGNLCHLFIQAAHEVRMSTDEGLTWISIGGPGDANPTTIWSNGLTVIAAAPTVYGNPDSIRNGSTHGAIVYKYELPKPTLAIDSFSITTCEKVVRGVHLAISGACHDSRLTAFALTGSSAFRLVNPPLLPDTLRGPDSIRIEYLPKPKSADTAVLILSICMPGRQVDTSIMLIGAGLPPPISVQLFPTLSRSSAPAGSITSLDVFPRSIVRNNGLDQLTFNLSYDGDLLSASGFQTGVAGASMSVGAVRRVGKTESVPITISGVNLTLDPNVPIVTAQMRALLTDSTSTAIEVSDPVLNGGDVNYRCTLGIEGDSTTFRMIDLCGDPTIRQFLSTKTLTINSIEPNPSTTHITIDIRNAFGNVKLEVYDLMGKLVHSQSAVEGKNGVDVAGLSVGSYVLRISDEKNVVSRMVVKLSEP